MAQSATLRAVAEVCRGPVGAGANLDLPPRKKRPPPDTDTPTTAAPAQSPAVLAGLRLAAGVIYANSTLSISDLAAHAQFRGVVTERSLQRWCSADKWPEQRRRTQAEWRRQVVVEMGKEVVAEHQRQLAALTGLFNKGLERATKLRPRTWEGTVSALAKLGRLLFEIRTSMAEGAASMFKNLPEAQVSGIHRGMISKPTDEEALAVAKALLDVRCRKQEEEYAAWQAEQAEAKATRPK